MDNQSIQILLIEDNPGDARLLQELLVEVASVQFKVEQVDQLSQGLERLRNGCFDIILLDLSLPDSREFETFAILHNSAREVPIVVITALNDETLAIRAMQEGAQDYLVKGQVNGELLVRSIRYAIERKRAEQKIREQAVLLDIATDAILVRGLEDKILFWNKGAENLYGWKAEEAINQTITQLLYKQISPQFQEAQKLLLAKGEWQGELNQFTKEGREIIVESRWTLVRDQDEKPKSILVVSTDITEKKRLAAQFLRTQRLESIGTLAGGIAHDLNNILTPVLAIAQLLQMKLPHLDERSQQMLKVLEVNARRGAELVKQVLSFAQGMEGEYTLLQVKHLIWEIQQIMQETFPKSIEVHTEVSDDLWTVNGNSTQLHQVLMNLCINARDAMPDGGILKISTENLSVDENYARMNLGAQAGPHIVITVSDTGTGIPAEIVDRIFEPFFTTKEIGKGTGLGLSTAVGILKSHAGFITVTSSVKGTQFKVFLPAIAASESGEVKALEALSGQNELILVVDDEEAILEVSKASLEAYRYRVLTAEDGIEAISLYAQYKQQISLVLVDMMMPAMDGLTTIRTLQKINPAVNVIAVSGLLSSAQTISLTQAGVQAFLSKPYTAKALVIKINEVLKAKDLPQEGL